MEEKKQVEEDTLTPIVVGLVAAVAIGLGLLAFLATFFGGIFGLLTGSATVVQLDINNHVLIKEVLFGGEPWLIYCVNNETAHYPLPAILDVDLGGEGTAALHSQIGMKVGVLDCFKEMPSGKTIAQRFTWGTAPPPFAFAIANGDAPFKVDLYRIKTSEELIEAVKPVLVIKTITIDSMQRWPTSCTTRRTCVVLGHKTPAALEGAMTIFEPMLQKHRKVKVATLDIKFWQMKLGQNLTASHLKIGKSNDLDVVCLARLDGIKDKKSVHVGSYLQSLVNTTLDQFLTDCAQQTNLVALGAEPKIAVKLAWGQKAEKPQVIEAEPLPSDFFKDGEMPKKDDGRRQKVGDRKGLEEQDEKVIEDVDESERQEEKPEEDDGEEVEL